ncbi:MAG: MoxR family ATPase [Planctomycetes bacterium]|nr:MoxR family ATPase [Planctomycetota bacterium]
MSATVQGLYAALRREVGKVVVGQEEAVRLAFVALLCEGHVILEGVPGLAKTTLVRALAAALRLEFKRVQFTPDLMPSDILGAPIFDFQAGKFHVVEGPIFTSVLLADEINRAPAKTQAALLEAMQERQVTLEGTPRPLPRPFLVLATQNPVEHEGTYPLPEAQLDRFLFKVLIDYPSLDDELAVLAQHRGDSAGLTRLLADVVPVADADGLAAARAEVDRVRVEPGVARYLVELVRRTRKDPLLSLGGSPRASLLLQVAARVGAALDGRDFVVPDDVKAVFVPCLRHRVRLTAAAEVDGLGPDEVLTRVLGAVAVPR